MYCFHLQPSFASLGLVWRVRTKRSRPILGGVREHLLSVTNKFVRRSSTPTASPSNVGLTRNVERASDCRKALSPIVAFAIIDIKLDTIAIALHFMKPRLARWSLGLYRCELGFNEPQYV
jgi:hypothetical protein